ncbi:hypothetical protein BDW42DRAFT_177146 [Aspergillus taichungensis]|uniref:Uncharacterized protein n=1 Tax=Aspergillus taichungensis TaxID=482145 RepID=A0A2J5HJS9_9EURO|nr:hypothetical protein BDW42DRAFT_177146 [Aspergillus taichungensis]
MISTRFARMGALVSAFVRTGGGVEGEAWFEIRPGRTWKMPAFFDAGKESKATES